MSGITGDFRGLRALLKNLQKVQDGGMVARLSQELAVEARKLVADEFRFQRDPYGEPWLPLKHRKGKILRDTGYMAGHVATYPTRHGFAISFLAPYAKVHQTGGKVKAHMRAAREMRRNGRGRFASGTRTKTGRARRGSFTVLARMQAGYTIPRRALLPSKGWGGLGPVWSKAFNRVARRVVRDQLMAQGSAGGMA